MSTYIINYSYNADLSQRNTNLITVAISGTGSGKLLITTSDDITHYFFVSDDDIYKIEDAVVSGATVTGIPIILSRSGWEDVIRSSI